jgi:hypothetical protein
MRQKTAQKKSAQHITEKKHPTHHTACRGISNSKTCSESSSHSIRTSNTSSIELEFVCMCMLTCDMNISSFEHVYAWIHGVLHELVFDIAQGQAHKQIFETRTRVRVLLTSSLRTRVRRAGCCDGCLCSCVCMCAYCVWCYCV